MSEERTVERVELLQHTASKSRAGMLDRQRVPLEHLRLDYELAPLAGGHEDEGQEPSLALIRHEAMNPVFSYALHCLSRTTCPRTELTAESFETRDPTMSAHSSPPAVSSARAPRVLLLLGLLSALACSERSRETGEPPPAPQSTSAPTFVPTHATLTFQTPSIESNPGRELRIDASSSPEDAERLRAVVEMATVNGTPLATAIDMWRRNNRIGLAMLRAAAPPQPDPGTGGAISTLTLFDADGVLFVDTSLDDYVLEGDEYRALRRRLAEVGTSRSWSDEAVALEPASPSGPAPSSNRPGPEGAPVRSAVPTAVPPTSFEIGSLTDGRFEAVATLSFDADQAGTLEMLHEEHEELQRAWNAMSDHESVTIKSGRRSRHGRHELRAETTTKGDPGFPRAVAQALADDVGMFVVSR